MSYRDVTWKLIYDVPEDKDRILVLCPGFKLFSDQEAIIMQRWPYTNLYTNKDDMDLNDWIADYLKTNSEPFDIVISLRLLEHLPYRNIDFYLFNIYNIMKKKAKFVCIVPNMFEIFNQLTIEYNKSCADNFRISRLNFELFGEGEHQWDFHKTYTSQKSMENILEREGLFKIIDIRSIVIETELVPPYLMFTAQRT